MKKLIFAGTVFAALMLFVGCASTPKNESAEPVSVSGTNGITITYKQSSKLVVQQYYIFNNKNICIFNKYNNFSPTFKFPYVNEGETYSYRLFYKYNGEQKIIDGSVNVEKGNGEFSVNDYATAVFEDGKLKVSNLKLPKIKGAEFTFMALGINEGNGGWFENYNWLDQIVVNNDEIATGSFEKDFSKILIKKQIDPDECIGKRYWISLAYNFKKGGNDYYTQLLEDGYFAFDFNK
ncbi:MAG: hypothetical protein K6A43_04630 [Treponema sp.]|nr:hypothetical protein [Treponema sp.]